MRITVPCSEAVASSLPSRLKLTATTRLRHATTLFKTFRSRASYKITCSWPHAYDKGEASERRCARMR